MKFKDLAVGKKFIISIDTENIGNKFVFNHVYIKTSDDKAIQLNNGEIVELKEGKEKDISIINIIF